VNDSPVFYVLLAAAIVLLAAGRAYLYRTGRLRGMFRALAGFEITVIAALLVAMILLGCLQIVLRNFFHSGILWADLLMRHIVLWVGCLGAALATTRVRHINIDVFSRLLPGRSRRIRRFFVYTATAVAAFVLGIASLRLVADERMFGEVAFGPVRTWMLQTVLPFAFYVISYRSVVNLLTGRESAEQKSGADGLDDGAGEAARP
jgi:TRAP-type C4-dicarboxylate transport system permease small subunit